MYAKLLSTKTVLLGVLLCLLMLSPAASAGERLTLTFSGHWDIDVPEILAAFDAYEQYNPNVSIDYVRLSSSRMLELLTVRHAGGALPDVMSVPARLIPALAELGIIAPVPPSWEQKAREVYIPQAMEMARYKGQIYGYPTENMVSALVYNGAHLDAAGVAETRPQTWEELASLAQKLTVSENGATVRPGFGIVETVSSGTPMLAMLGSHVWANGGNFFDLEGEITPRFTSPEVVAAVEYYLEMQQLGIGGRVWGADKFGQGLMSMSIPQGPWWRSTVLSNAGEELYAQMGSWMTPAGSTGKPGHYHYGWVVGVSTTTSVPDEAHAMLLWLTTVPMPDGTTPFYRYYGNLGSLPVTIPDIEAHRGGILQEKFMSGFLEAFLTAPLYQDPYVPPVADLLVLIGRGGYDVYRNGMAPMEALSLAEQDAKNLIAQYNQQ